MPRLTMEGRVMAAINAERLRTTAAQMMPLGPKPIADQIALAAARHVLDNTIVPSAFDERAPCMYSDSIVAADDTCLRCKVKSGEDCRDI